MGCIFASLSHESPASPSLLLLLRSITKFLQMLLELASNIKWNPILVIRFLIFILSLGSFI